MERVLRRDPLDLRVERARFVGIDSPLRLVRQA